MYKYLGTKRPKYAWIEEEKLKQRHRDQKKQKKSCLLSPPRKKRKLTTSVDSVRTINDFFSPRRQKLPEAQLQPTTPTSTPTPTPTTYEESQTATPISLPRKPVFTAKILHNRQQQNQPDEESNFNMAEFSLGACTTPSTAPTKSPSHAKNSQLWTQQFAPKQSADIIGNKQGIHQLTQFLQDWKQRIAQNIKTQHEQQLQNSKTSLSDYFSASGVSRKTYIERYKNKNKNKKRNKKPIVNNNNKQQQQQHRQLYKAVLLIGPSGSCKSMAVHLLCKELGFDAVHYSSLDLVSSAATNRILSIFDNHTLAWHCKQKTSSDWSHAQHYRFDLHFKSRVLVLEDTEYLVEHSSILRDLVVGVKKTKVPIILVANSYTWNRGLQELAKHCLRIQFERVNVDRSLITASVTRLNTICADNCHFDNVPLITSMLAEMYGDYRSSLLLLQFWCDTHESSVREYVDATQPMHPHVLSCVLSMKNERFLMQNNGNKLWLHKHDEVMNIFESNQRFFNTSLVLQGSLPVHQAIKWYFNSPSLTLLFVYENYVRTAQYYKHRCNAQQMESIANASEMIADGDLLETHAHSQQNYALMPMTAIASCLAPSKLMCQTFGGLQRVRFPNWFAAKKKISNVHQQSSNLHQQLLRNDVSCFTRQQCVLEYIPCVGALRGADGDLYHFFQQNCKGLQKLCQ